MIDTKLNNYVSLKNISKIYPNGFQAIFDFNLEIQKGEFIVIVGPSGCGKSTTIRMIAGLEDVSSGEIFLAKRNITNVLARKRNVSMVFQNYALFPHLSVKDNIAFALKVKRRPREIIAQKVKWASTILKLSYLLNRKPAQLSGGQRQRVALGRSIVAEPTLFLMDEPLSNLDAKLRSKMRATIRKLHDNLGTTSIYVTHDQVEAMTMADKIVVMDDGFVQQVGTPDEIFHSPANTFVASFIGTPSINLLSGEFENGVFTNKRGSVVITKKIFRKHLTKKVQLGVRPQYVKAYKKRVPNSFKYKVEFIETLGAEVVVILDSKFSYVCLSEEKPKINDVVYLTFNLDKVMLFEKKNGVSLTSKINEITQKSLDIFYQSKNLIFKRKMILEKHKSKNLDLTLFQKLVHIAKKWMFSEFILLNPELSSLKKDKRKIIIKIKDSRRRKNQKEIQLLQSDKKKIASKIWQLEKKLWVFKKHLLLFNKYRKKVMKIKELTSEIKLQNKETQEIEKLHSLAISIKEVFNETLEYDFDKMKKFNKLAKTFFNKNKKSVLWKRKVNKK